jgi:3-dehydroquinate dehydratase-2
MPARVLVLHGPNLNLRADLADIDAQLDKKARGLGLDLKTFQSNALGALIDALHAERTKVSGIIVNLGRLAPMADTLAEAIELVARPTVEVLFESGLKSRSALKSVVLEQAVGKGTDGYLHALERLAKELKASTGRPTRSIEVQSAPHATVVEDENAVTGPVLRSEVKKSLGKKQQAPSGDASADGVRKTLGRGEKGVPEAAINRAMVREKISERLSGQITTAGLATWARGQWQQLQRGAPAESGQRDRLEDILQTLVLSAQAKANDHQLIELMTQLG